MIWIKRTAITLIALSGIVIASAHLKALPGETLTPAGFKRNSAWYVPAEDGTRIAVDLWLPSDLTPDEQIPALIEGSRYWRDVAVTTGGRILHLFGLSAPGMEPGDSARFFTAKGYAYVTVEVRGSGASFGVHDAPYSLQEMADYGSILDWIVAQPWSNGRVGSVGVSYAGTTAELMTTTGHPALKAAAPLYADFDTQYHLATPGGIYQPAFVDAWSEVVLAMDGNDTCAVVQASSTFECFLTRLLVGGIKPVNGSDTADLARAISEHDSQDPAMLVNALQYRDSTWGDVSYSSLENQAYARKSEIEASAVPMYIVAGWLDAATVEGALARFASFSNPQTVTLAPFSHGGGFDTDPFKALEARPVWSRTEQITRLEEFFAIHLKDAAAAQPRRLSYYVMGGDRWRTTDHWPPAGFDRRDFYLAANGELATASPRTDAATAYTVDFEAGTEPRTRWMTQLSGGDVVYDAREEATSRLLSFTSEPFDESMELTGSVVLEFFLTTDRPDGAVHAYLDIVTPEGTTHYLTGGRLPRALRDFCVCWQRLSAQAEPGGSGCNLLRQSA